MRGTAVPLLGAPGAVVCRSGYFPDRPSFCPTSVVLLLAPEFIDANTDTGQFVVERDRYVDG
jgi:hypothetical protein